MPDADVTAELRALQARAYGRDGGLSAAEAERLRQLESARASSSASSRAVSSTGAATTGVSRTAQQDESGEQSDWFRALAEDTDDETTRSGAVPVAGAADLAAPDDVSAGRRSAGDEADADGGRGRGGGESRGPLRRYGKIVAAVSVLLLVLGLGAGWALFGRHGTGVELTASEHQRRAEIESTGKFDDGTLRAIGRSDDALVWYGTKSDGTFGCIVLDTEASSSSSCSRMEDMNNMGVSATAMLTARDDGTDIQLSATALRATSGEIVAVIQTFDTGGYDWDAQFTGAERVRSKELQAEGFQPFSYSIVGYFRGEPVWETSSFDGISGDRCLIVDAVDARSCAPDTGTPEGFVLHGSSPDEQGVVRDWRVELAYTSNGASYLKVEGDTSAEDGVGDAG